MAFTNIQKLIHPTFFFFIIITSLFQHTACNSTKNISQNKWYGSDSSIVIDGVLGDWNQQLQQPSNFTNIQYAIGNDAENLYLCVRIPDNGIQNRIMALGMSVYIDTLGKKRDKIGVGYPLALTPEQVETISIQAQKGGIKIDDREFNKAYAANCQEFELIGFVAEDDKEKIRASNLASKDLKTATGFDHIDAMVCEFKIPFYQLFKNKITYNEIISISIRVNNPEANADEDPGLFNDPSNNQITGSNQIPNPLSGQQQPIANRQPSRSSSNVIGVSIKTALAKPF